MHMCSTHHHCNALQNRRVQRPEPFGYLLVSPIYGEQVLDEVACSKAQELDVGSYRSSGKYGGWPFGHFSDRCLTKWYLRLLQRFALFVNYLLCAPHVIGIG